MKAAIATVVTSLITSNAVRETTHRARAALRAVSGAKPRVLYFHDPGDPHANLAAQVLPKLEAAYDAIFERYVVSPPDAAAAPERARLAAWASADAARLARAHGLSPDARPMIEGPNGDALRARLGHYLGATFYYQGEWFWGLDRLAQLEARLARHRRANAAPVVAQLEAGDGAGLNSGAATLDFFLSFRSPYTYLAAQRVRRLAERHQAHLRYRFVLPMVMRGLPVPPAKRLYIVRDTKREANRLGLPFGRIVDPVGRPTERGLAILHKAVALGRGGAFAESFLKGVFADGVDAGSDQGLRRLVERAGIDWAQAQEALSDDSWRQTAEANRTELFALGLWGVPSFRVGDMPGHWGQDRLWAVEEDLIQAAKTRMGAAA